MLWVGPTPRRAPALARREWDGRLRKLCGLSPFSLWRAFVKSGARARCMNNEDATGTRGFHRFIQRPCHLGDPPRSGLAPMIVPHITDDQCGLFRLPTHFVLDDFEA